MSPGSIRAGAFGRRQAAWRAAAPIPGVDPDFARLDAFGTEIHWHQYGRLGAVYGWQIAVGCTAAHADLPLALHWCNAVLRRRLPTAETQPA